MQPLNCFTSHFSLASSHRFVFQNGPEKPSQAPKPPKAAKEATQIEKAGENIVDATKKRLEELRQNIFNERVGRVKELYAKMPAFREGGNFFNQGYTNENEKPEKKAEYDLINEQMVDLAKQFNAELGLNIDFKKLQFLEFKPVGKGISMVVSYKMKNEKQYDIDIGLRPDGTYETCIITSLGLGRDRFPLGDHRVYFDSRTGKRATYKVYLPSKPGTKDHPELIRFEKERTGPVRPSTE